MNSLVSPEKPKALHKGSQIAAIAPASPAKEERITSGRRALERLGFSVAPQRAMHPQGYFTGSPEDRRAEFLAALGDASIDALIATRGGYGSAYLLEEPLPERLSPIKPVIGDFGFD